MPSSIPLCDPQRQEGRKSQQGSSILLLCPIQYDWVSEEPYYDAKFFNASFLNPYCILSFTLFIADNALCAVHVLFTWYDINKLFTCYDVTLVIDRGLLDSL